MLSDAPSKVVYNLASTTPIADGYEVTFTYFDKSEVQCYLEGSDGKETQIDDDNYTVDESDTTAAVIFISGYAFPEGSEKLVIMRVVAYEQESDYRNGDKIDADKIERSLDLLTAMVQQVAELVDRTIQKPKSETGTIILPSVEQRAGMLLGFDDEGNFKPLLASDIDEKYQQTVAAKETAVAAAGTATESATKANQYMQQTVTAATQALSDISAAKDRVIQLIQEANLEQIQILTQKAEELEASMIQIEDHIEIMVSKIKDSESNVSYLANAAKLWANKAIDAANLASAIKNSCSTILGQIQEIQANVQSMQSDIQERQSDVASKHSAVLATHESVETDKGIVAADKAATETLKEQTVAAKSGADASVAEITTLKSQITALAGSTMPGMTFAVGSKIYQRSFYVKNGRTYFYDEEVQQNTN